jgi:hypothetical protein
MAKNFTAQVLSRARSSRKSTRAVEESSLVVLALDTHGFLRGEWRVGSALADDNSDCGQCGSHKAEVATNQKPLAAARAAGKGPERSGIGTKQQSMAKNFTAQVLSRARSSRKSTRAVEESSLVVLALDALGFLRGEWRVGRSRLGVENRG